MWQVMCQSPADRLETGATAYLGIAAKLRERLWQALSVKRNAKNRTGCGQTRIESLPDSKQRETALEAVRKKLDEKGAKRSAT